MLSFYLETSVLGSLAPRQPRDRKRVVQRLLALLQSKNALAVMSAVVIQEIEAASAPIVTTLQDALIELKPVVLRLSSEAESLANSYLDEGILPRKRELDALHVAIATCSGCDYLVSWNHRHLTRPTMRMRYEEVNIQHGYSKTPLICNPVEACDELRSR